MTSGLSTTHLFARLCDLGVGVPDLVALVEHHIMPVVGEDLILVDDQCGEGSDEDPPVLYDAPNQVLLQHTKSRHLCPNSFVHVLYVT